MTYIAPIPVPPTQTEIDTAVLKIKGMQYHLVWELAMEEKYGGDISCCKQRAILFYLWKTALACQTAIRPNVNASGTITFTLGSATSDTTLQMEISHAFSDAVFISDAIQLGENTLAQWIQALADSVNSYQTVYTATAHLGVITVTGNCKTSPPNQFLDVDIEGPPADSTIVDFNGGICEVTEADNCLTSQEIFDLIGKINTACS